MFTGIITAIGAVQRADSNGGGLDLTIVTPYSDLVPGESVAVDGACLTAETVNAGSFTARVIRTSLDRTGFARYTSGRRVNLERALQAGDRLGGHLVQGHVDGVGTVVRRGERDDARLLDIEVPPDIGRVSIPLGSITVDGVSLTVNQVLSVTLIQVSLIPFTLQHTTLGDRAVGDRVHLEGDTIGKYVAGLLDRRERGGAVKGER
jgi:riboflavin synthase